MIRSLKITDNTNAPLHHLPKLKPFANGAEFTFRKGVNVIIGKNGSGKSTMMNLLRIYTFCDCELESTMRRAKLIDGISGSFDKLTRGVFDTKFLGGVDVVADYGLKTFNLCTREEYSSNEQFSGARLYARMESGSKSAGEKRLLFFDMMCGKMFDGKIGFTINLDFCPEDAREAAKEYYERNQKNADEVMPTILMDEPDQNLDVVNGKHLYGILGKKQREDTQVICSLHNPALIYKLSKLANVNFIELTEGYLDKVIKFVTK